MASKHDTHLNSTWDFPEGQVTISQYILRIFYSRMFLWVENGTWPSLDSRQEGEAVRRVWDWKIPLGSLILPPPPFFLYKLQSYVQWSWVTNSYSSGSVLRVSYCWHRTISCTVPILSFMKAINLFNMQG